MKGATLQVARTSAFLIDCAHMQSALNACEAIILDPPFDQWRDAPVFECRTKICFTNWQNRHAVEARYGQPRFELIWHFADGRWTSHRLPRTTHESILVYGPTGESYVGPENTDVRPQKKGRGSVGRHKLATRVYEPRPRKALNSVLCYPRNVRGKMGCWGKPLGLITDLLNWCGAKTYADPYAGAFTVSRAAAAMDGVSVIACEIDAQTFEAGTNALRQHIAELQP